MKRAQRYSVTGGLDESTSDTDTQPTSFVVLENARADKRLGAIIKRNGSATETITDGLGVPLGIAEYITGASTGLIPTTRQVLANFGGSDFYELSNSSWSSVSATAHTDFGSSRLNTMDQLGGNLFIAGGRPAKWDGSGDVDRVGIPAPAGTITHTVSGTGITGSFTYMFTFYDSSTGLESDWSPVSATASPSNQQVNLTIPTATPTGTADKVRIYRTTDGGALYYLLQTQDIATGSYTDTTSDTNLQAGSLSADLGEYGLPPATSYLCAAFSSHVWWVDAANPQNLYYSKPYIGNDNDTQYVPDSNVLRFDEPITALLVTTSQMLVFHARNISSISGTSAANFIRQNFVQGTGTVFPHSVATNGEFITFLAEEGYVVLSGSGKQHVSRPVDRELIPLLRDEYNSSLYINTQWNPGLRQFIYQFTAIAEDGAPWEIAGNGGFAQWEDSSTLFTANWEDSTSPGAEATLRTYMWGWSPELKTIWSKYTHPYATDLNGDNKFVSFIFCPQPSSDLLAPQTEYLLMGYYDGTDGHIAKFFDSDQSTDDGTNITATAITGRVVPGSDAGNYKLLRALRFLGNYADPASNGSTLKYLLDMDDPQLSYTSGDLVDFAGSGDRKRFTDAKGRFFHLYVQDATSNSDNIILQDFVVEYRERLSSEGR